MLHPCEATPNQIIPDFSISRRRVNAALCPAKNVSPETGIEYRGRPPPLWQHRRTFIENRCATSAQRDRGLFSYWNWPPRHIATWRHVISDMKYTYIHIYSVVQCRFHSSIVKYFFARFFHTGPTQTNFVFTWFFHVLVSIPIFKFISRLIIRKLKRPTKCKSC